VKGAYNGRKEREEEEEGQVKEKFTRRGKR
jgi:hypothetical protein